MITVETFASLRASWRDPGLGLKWGSVFMLPAWLETWWRIFGKKNELCLRGVKQDSRLIGIAPLIVKDGAARLIGSGDVCDYLDFVSVPGAEDYFSTALLDYLEREHVGSLELVSVRQDSLAMVHLLAAARQRGWAVEYSRDNVSVEMELPSSWEGYLASLDARYRHEVERKLRRLAEAGKVTYRIIEEPAAVPAAMDLFLRLFAASRRDKAAFMTLAMGTFFRALALAMAEVGLLRLGVLELDGLPLAMVMCFDYAGRRYLYNSGYDPERRYLSPGLLCKVFCIRDGIERRLAEFDFLKGGEAYKYQLGGREEPLFSCVLNFKPAAAAPGSTESKETSR